MSQSADDDRVTVPEGTDPEEFLKKLLKVDPDEEADEGAPEEE